MQFWNELEGRTIDGVYPLRRLVRSEGRHAWFETETAEPQAGPATISLTEAATDADEVLERLQAAQKLKHPNLVTITKVGQVRVDTTLVIYAVMEHIEQSLSDVLQAQALSPEEGREVAEALVSSLTAIHQQGMSHGRVEAASVLATEETVKLRSDCLHITAAGQADDVAAIGPTLFHAFTQRKALTATDAQINRIPAPFGEIIRNSFARRWTLAQISNALKPVLPAASVIPQPPCCTAFDSSSRGGQRSACPACGQSPCQPTAAGVSPGRAAGSVKESARRRRGRGARPTETFASVWRSGCGVAGYCRMACCCGLARRQLPRKHRTHPRKRLLRRRLLRQPRHRQRFPRPNRGPQNLVRLLLLWRRGPLPPLFPQTGGLSGGWLLIPTGDRPKPPTWWLRSVTNTRTWMRRFSIRREEAGFTWSPWAGRWIAMRR